MRATPARATRAVGAHGCVRAVRERARGGGARARGGTSRSSRWDVVDDDSASGDGAASAVFDARAAFVALGATAVIGLASASAVRAEGFGSSTSAVVNQPKRGVEVETLLRLDEKARNRETSALTRGNIDILLQELNALNAVDEQELEQVDAELALLAAQNLEGELNDFVNSDAYANLSAQKQRIVEKRANEAALQRRLKERKVIFGQLAAQSPVIVYGAAFVASVVSNTAMHPLDTMKVRKISLKQNKGIAASLDEDMGANDTMDYEPTWDEIVGEDGFKSLYSGLMPNLAKEGVPLGVYLGLYEYAKDYLLTFDDFRPHPIAIYLVAGGFGEFFASILRVPAEAVKNGTQIGLTVGEAWQTNVATPAAAKNLFKCWKTALIRDIPFGGIQLAIFEYLKLILISLSIQALDPDAPVTEALFGAIGGSIAAYITTPVDVVITRMINERKSQAEAGLPEDTEGTSPTETARAVWDEQGLAGFFVGGRERILYWGPAISIFLTVYCRIRQHYIVLP